MGRHNYCEKNETKWWDIYIFCHLTLGPLGYFYHHGPRSILLITTYTDLVCMCSSTNYLWLCTIMYYMSLIWLPWQSCTWLIL